MYSLRNFLREPYRPFFLIGALELIAGMTVWFLWRHAMVSGWWQHWPWAIEPMAFHGLTVVHGGALAFVVGFALTAFFHQNGGAPLSGRSLAAVAGVFALSRVLTWAGAFGAPGSQLLEAFRFASWLGEFLVITAALALCAQLYFQNSVGQIQPAAVIASFVFTLISMLPPLQGIIARELITMVALPSFILAFGYRVVPFFGSKKIAGYELRRGRYTLQIALVLFSILTVFTIMRSYSGFKGGTTALAQTLLAALLVRELIIWRFWRLLAEPMIAVLIIGLMWLAVGYAHAIADLRLFFMPEEVAVLRLVRLHMIGVGGVITMIAGIGLRVGRGHAGVAVKAGVVGIAVFLLVQLAAVVRIFPSQAQWMRDLGIAEDGYPAAAILAFAFAIWLARVMPLLFYRKEAD